METSYLILDAFIRKFCPSKLEKLIGYLEQKQVYEQTSFPHHSFYAKDFLYAQNKLKKTFKIHEQTITINELLGFFLKKTLLNYLETIVLPIPYLQKSLMTPLLFLSKKQLITLIDYLSLYDLAFELKHIVDKKEKSLRLLMHKRGVFRFSIALSSQSKELIWHIIHRLDKGRGGMLQKCIKKEIASHIVDSVQASVIELIESENL